MPDLNRSIEDHRASLTDLRRAIHAWPEPGFEEVRTQARLKAELEAIGLNPRACGGTGLVCDLGSGPRTVALRADIDCLRMTEANPELSWRSEREGLAHMCGHDGHAAALVGAARLLVAVQDELPGRVRLLFQPAEEGPGGAPVMIKDGCLEGVDEVYGMHNWPNIPLGTLRTISGPCMAHVAEFNAVITGVGGHASEPTECRDPVLAAAHITTALQSVVSRFVSYQDAVVISVTQLHAGEAFNVIPDTARLGGTIRILRDEVWDTIEERMRRIVCDTATALGCTAELHFDRMYPATVNSPEQTAAVERLGRAYFGPEAVSSEDLPMLGAEDFSYFLQQRPGCYFFLGSGEEGRTNAPCHATDFDFNDALIAPAVGFWVRLVEDRLDAQLYSGST